PAPDAHPVAPRRRLLTGAGRLLPRRAGAATGLRRTLGPCSARAADRADTRVGTRNARDRVRWSPALLPRRRRGSHRRRAASTLARAGSRAHLLHVEERRGDRRTAP